MLLLMAIEGVILFVAFLYLVHLVSTIRNILRVQIFWQMSKYGIAYSKESLKVYEQWGVISKATRKSLEMELEDAD